MGFCYPVVMDWDDIKEIVPKEAAVFEQRLGAADMSIDEFCCEHQNDWRDAVDDWDDDPEVLDAWKSLNAAFTVATTVEGAGLDLQAAFDEVGFFAVGGACVWTPAGNKYDDKLNRISYDDGIW